MKRKVIYIVFTFIMLLSITTGCQSGNLIKEEIAYSFIEMNSDAIDQINLDIQEINQELYTTEEKILKLDQVVTMALEWEAYQKNRAKDEDYAFSWVNAVNPEGLDKLKNDKYQVTMLRGKGTSSGEFTATIRVTDLTLVIKIERNWQDIDNELKTHKALLEQQKQDKLANAELALSTLKSMVQSSETWEIDTVDATTCNVKGNGLGWEGKLTTGIWTYYRNTGELRPSYINSEALRKVLSIES